MLFRSNEQRVQELERISGLTSEQAKEYLLKTIEEDVKLDKMCIRDSIMNVSVTDLKRNYENLNVHFELWKGESDAQPYVCLLYTSRCV